MLKLCMVIFILLIQFSAYSTEFVVEIYKKKFIPAHITVKVGDTIIWKNIEKRQYHNVWFKQLDKEEPDYLFPSETYQKSFPTAGEFPYECGPHPRMKGAVTVIE